MNHQELKKEREEIEILTADDAKLRQMLGGLKRVNAPKNFDFQLKARIAKARPQDYEQPFFTPFLRFVLPLSLTALLVGFVFFNFSFSGENQSAPTVADKVQPTENQFAPPETVDAPTVDESTVASAATNENSEAKREASEIAGKPKKTIQNNNEFVAARNPSRSRTEKTESSPKNDFGGTRLRTGREPVVITGNTNPSSANTKSPSISQHNLTFREVLSGIGIQADYVENSWRIIAVEETSAAGRAGLLVGDVIKEIDGKKPASDKAFVKRFSGRMFSVLRDGQLKIIDLNQK